MRSIAQTLFSRPWAVQQYFLKSISEHVDQNYDDSRIQALRNGSYQAPVIKPFIDGGTAYLPIHGVISKRLNILNSILGSGVSVVEITKAFKSLIQNDQITRIVLDIDSPGGSVEGVVELSDLIYESRKAKPITAYTDGQMLSAAYWIGSSAHKVYATKGAEIGSIGVYSIIHDYSVAEHNAGIQTHVVKSSKYKPLSHPSTPLSADARDQIQDDVDTYFQFFVDAVSRNRMMLKDRAIELSDGRSMIAQTAHMVGLIDGVKSEAVKSPTPKKTKASAVNKDEWASNSKLRQEFKTKSAYESYMKAKARGLTK